MVIRTPGRPRRAKNKRGGVHLKPQPGGVGCVALAVPLDLAVSRDFAVVPLAFSLDNFTPIPAPHLAARCLCRSCSRCASCCHRRFLLRVSSFSLCLLVGPELGFVAPALLNMARQGCRGRSLTLAKIHVAHATRTDEKKSRRTRDYFSVRPIDHFTPNLLDCARANKIISQRMDQRLEYFQDKEFQWRVLVWEWIKLATRVKTTANMLAATLVANFAR